MYTADGHLFKAWNGPITTSEDEVDLALGAGIKLFDWSKNGVHMAIGDFTDRVTVLSAPSFSESMSVVHTTSVRPTESLQVRSIVRSYVCLLTRQDLARADKPISNGGLRS